MVLSHNTCDIQNGTAWHKDEWHDGRLCHGHITANGSGWWNYGANGKVAGKWGVNENVGDCGSNNENNNNPDFLQALQEIEEEVPVPHNQGNPPRTDNSGGVGGGGVPKSTPQPQTSQIPTNADTQTATPGDAESTPADDVQPIEDCSSLTGYAIEVNDKNQIRLIAQKRFSSELHLWFDDNSIIAYDEHITPYGVMFGFEAPKALSVLEYNRWLDMDDLPIINLLQHKAKCLPCENLRVADALKMVLMVYVGEHICPVAEYPEPAPAAPSLYKPKLTTMWGTLKQQ